MNEHDKNEIGNYFSVNKLNGWMLGVANILCLIAIFSKEETAGAMYYGILVATIIGAVYTLLDTIKLIGNNGIKATIQASIFLNLFYGIPLLSAMSELNKRLENGSALNYLVVILFVLLIIAGCTNWIIQRKK